MTTPSKTHPGSRAPALGSTAKAHDSGDLTRLEAVIAEMRESIAVLAKRIVALEAQLDHISARGRF
jgi:hypothetical protein